VALWKANSLRIVEDRKSNLRAVSGEVMLYLIT
jgi:hypothetical protein